MFCRHAGRFIFPRVQITNLSVKYTISIDKWRGLCFYCFLYLALDKKFLL